VSLFPELQDGVVEIVLSVCYSIVIVLDVRVETHMPKIHAISPCRLRMEPVPWSLCRVLDDLVDDGVL
jgi:hypothetical protein